MDSASTSWESVVTAVGAALTALWTGIQLCRQRRHRALPDWDWSGTPRLPKLEERAGASGALLLGELHNIGDAPGFHVEVEGVRCRAKFVEVQEDSPDFGEKGPRFLTSVASGTSVLVRVHCEREEWDRAELELTWTEPPTRLGKRRSRRWLLRGIAESPWER